MASAASTLTISLTLSARISLVANRRTLGATTLSFTNTSARVFPASRIWINQEYYRDIDGLAVGQTLSLELNSFVDRYNSAFRGGGFFATQAPDKVVLAQIETEGKMLGFVVVENK